MKALYEFVRWWRADPIRSNPKRVSRRIVVIVGVFVFEEDPAIVVFLKSCKELILERIGEGRFDAKIKAES